MQGRGRPLAPSSLGSWVKGVAEVGAAPKTIPTSEDAGTFGDPQNNLRPEDVLEESGALGCPQGCGFLH